MSATTLSGSARTRRLIISAMLLAVATVLAVVCEFIPFLNLPFGGGFTIASMLPIVVLAYMYGTKWGLLCGFTFSVIQMLIGMRTVSAFFLPSDESYMGIVAALLICLIDYVLAYTALGLGGLFRDKLGKTPALVLGSVVALSLRYLAHFISGYIFFGSWAEWFFSQDGFPAGKWFLDTFGGMSLEIVYSIVYNGLYMIPEIIITAIVAVPISRIKQIEKN